MKVIDSTKWIQVDRHASSLFDVISDGNLKPTEAGKDLWKSLINRSYLQQNCNKEGFNLILGGMKVRIGLIANNEDSCGSVDSCIGFGILVHLGGVKITSSCGNLYFNWPNKDIAAFGFILIK